MAGGGLLCGMEFGPAPNRRAAGTALRRTFPQEGPARRGVGLVGAMRFEPRGTPRFLRLDAANPQPPGGSGPAAAVLQAGARIVQSRRRLRNLVGASGRDASGRRNNPARLWRAALQVERAQYRRRQRRITPLVPQ